MLKIFRHPCATQCTRKRERERERERDIAIICTNATTTTANNNNNDSNDSNDNRALEVDAQVQCNPKAYLSSWDRSHLSDIFCQIVDPIRQNEATLRHIHHTYLCVYIYICIYIYIYINNNEVLCTYLLLVSVLSLLIY